MVTPEQARSYDVEMINVGQGFAVSVSGDVGSIDIFMDGNGMKCEVGTAVSAIISWPNVEMWTVVQLSDFATQTIH